MARMGTAARVCGERRVRRISDELGCWPIPPEAETQCVALVLGFRILLVSRHAEGSDRSLRACRTFRVAAAFFATLDLSSLMIIAA